MRVLVVLLLLFASGCARTKALGVGVLPTRHGKEQVFIRVLNKPERHVRARLRLFADGTFHFRTWPHVRTGGTGADPFSFVGTWARCGSEIGLRVSQCFDAWERPSGLCAIDHVVRGAYCSTEVVIPRLDDEDWWKNPLWKFSGRHQRIGPETLPEDIRADD